MKTIKMMIELPPNMTRRTRPRWTHLILAAMIAFGVGVVGQGVAAPGDNPNKPVLTKSGKKAALKAAAAAITQAAPTSPVDQTKVPHYFGPFPNWVNSPFTLPDVGVTITGDGTGATASATVGANGAVTGVTITNPGSGYTAATVGFTGPGTGATADAVVTPSNAVTAITVAAGGAGYTAPLVTISGGGATTQATATAYGGVNAVAVPLATQGSGYTNPTVDFDMPDGADGVKAVAHALCDGGPVCGPTGAITAIVVDQPGSGYSYAPNVVIRNGTIYDPAPGGSGAAATATLEIQTVALDTFGAGYTSAPSVAINDTSPGIGAGALATATFNAGLVTAINLTAPGSGYITAGASRSSRIPCRACATPPSQGVAPLPEQPGTVHPAGGARHHDVPGEPHDDAADACRGLLRDRGRPAPRADEFFAAFGRDPAARIRAARDPGQCLLEQAHRPL